MLEMIFITGYVLSGIVSLGALIQIRGFLKAHPTIESEEALERFKRIARMNMYLALAIGVVLFGGGGLGVFMIFRYGSQWLIYVLLANGVTLGLGMTLSRYEKKTREMSADSELLAVEHKRVSQSWTKKMFPDF